MPDSVVECQCLMFLFKVRLAWVVVESEKKLELLITVDNT